MAAKSEWQTTSETRIAQPNDECLRSSSGLRECRLNFLDCIYNNGYKIMGSSQPSGNLSKPRNDASRLEFRYCLEFQRKCSIGVALRDMGTCINLPNMGSIWVRFMRAVMVLISYFPIPINAGERTLPNRVVSM